MYVKCGDHDCECAWEINSEDEGACEGCMESCNRWYWRVGESIEEIDTTGGRWFSIVYDRAFIEWYERVDDNLYPPRSVGAGVPARPDGDHRRHGAVVQPGDHTARAEGVDEPAEDHPAATPAPNRREVSMNTHRQPSRPAYIIQFTRAGKVFVTRNIAPKVTVETTITGVVQSLEAINGVEAAMLPPVRVDPLTVVQFGRDRLHLWRAVPAQPRVIRMDYYIQGFTQRSVEACWAGMIQAITDRIVTLNAYCPPLLWMYYGQLVDGVWSYVTRESKVWAFAPDSTLRQLHYGNVRETGAICFGDSAPRTFVNPQDIERQFFGSLFSQDYRYSPWVESQPLFTPKMINGVGFIPQEFGCGVAAGYGFPTGVISIPPRELAITLSARDPKKLERERQAEPLVSVVLDDAYDLDEMAELMEASNESQIA